MTVRELAERLSTFPDDAEIRISIRQDGVTYITGVDVLRLMEAPAFAPDSPPALFLFAEGE